MIRVTTFLMAVGTNGPIDNRVSLGSDACQDVITAAMKHLPATDQIAAVLKSGLNATDQAADVIGEVLRLEGRRFFTDLSLSTSVLPHRVHAVVKATIKNMVQEPDRDAAVILLWPGLIHAYWGNTQLAGTVVEHGDVVQLDWDVPENGHAELVNCQLHTDRDIG